MIGETFLQLDTNFNVAFEITKLYNFGSDIKIDYSGYIELEVYLFSNNNGQRTRELMAVHRCTIEEYKTKFYSNGESRTENWFDGQLFCLDKPELLNI